MGALWFMRDAELCDEAESASFANCASYSELAAHAGHQATADAQAQSGSSVLTSGGGIGLLEIVKYGLQPVGRDTNTGIGHRDADPAGLA